MEYVTLNNGIKMPKMCIRDRIYASDEEMASMMNVSVDILNDVGISASQEEINAVTIYDMIAQDPYSGTNVIILYENLSLVQDLSLIHISYDYKSY